MFKFLKDKLKGAISKFSDKTEQEASKESVEKTDKGIKGLGSNNKSGGKYI